jgi:hypothetical protein
VARPTINEAALALREAEEARVRARASGDARAHREAIDQQVVAELRAAAAAGDRDAALELERRGAA